jgi:hypothetical protein
MNPRATPGGGVEFAVGTSALGRQVDDGNLSAQ